MTRAGMIFGLLLGTAVAAANVARAADTRPLSPAQIALFESNHLKNVNRDTVLDYSFEHRGGASGDFQDKVTARIGKTESDGKKEIAVTFLTGNRQLQLPAVSQFSGNPLLMAFLQHDVMQMKEATGGSELYFRNRIREAFVDRAKIAPTEIILDGKKVPAQEIVIKPFPGEVHMDQFPDFIEKTYRFVLSDAVPGTIYRISTSVPKPETGAKKPFEETLTYVGQHDETP